MTEPENLPHQTEPARSFGQVADAYDRARPSYPKEAAEWLVNRAPVSHTGPRILELGAGTGKLTEQLAAVGHKVVATDPSERMLRQLLLRVPQAMVTLATAESIPLRSRSVDVVVSAQAFHWFDTDRALPEIARVLRPGGVLAVVRNARDERIPWVKRLGTIIGDAGHEDHPTRAIDESGLFGDVETKTFRFWQQIHQESLRDLVVSRSNVSVLEEAERDEVLAKVKELYDEYGRGPDGMLLPYVTHAVRAEVRPRRPSGNGAVAIGSDDVDTDSLLIDFH